MTGTLARLALGARADLLVRVATAIEASPPVGEPEFLDALEAVIAAGVRSIDVARRFSVEPSTITRWRRGAMPHQIARRVYAPQLAVLARR